MIPMDWKARAKALKTDIPAVFIALRHPRTPWYAKASALLIIGYALSPIDLIPDFIPVLGYLDDLIILPALVALTIHWIPAEVLLECRHQAALLGKEYWQKKWVYAIPFLLVWFLVLFFAGRLVYRKFLMR
jgi:uncharacterized membrane protein YkvA (DUF1232 family)